MRTTRLRQPSGTVAFVAPIAFLFLTACANVNTTEPARPQASPEAVHSSQVVFDNTLASTFRVVSVNQTTVSGNLLKVQATVENLRNRTHTLNYKFEWIDADGMAIDPPNETWKSVRILGRENIAISSVSVSPRAVDFRLKFRE